MSRTAADEELISAARAGSENALEKLMHRHKHLVRLRARSYFLIGGDKDDLIQEGMIGLFKAVRDFDPAAGISFRAFAEMCITRQMITAIKNATRQKHLPLNSYVSLHGDRGGDSDRYYKEFLSRPGSVDPVETVLAAERIRDVREITRNYLTPMEATVFVGYMSGQSYREIAASLSCRTKAVDNALQRVKRKVAALSDRPS